MSSKSAVRTLGSPPSLKKVLMLRVSDDFCTFYPHFGPCSEGEGKTIVCAKDIWASLISAFFTRTMCETLVARAICNAIRANRFARIIRN